ncbi:hypothetical protein Ancab_039159 [Ancistrocladus abbreviatus]
MANPTGASSSLRWQILCFIPHHHRILHHLHPFFFSTHNRTESIVALLAIVVHAIYHISNHVVRFKQIQLFNGAGAVLKLKGSSVAHRQITTIKGMIEQIFLIHPQGSIILLTRVIQIQLVILLLIKK